MDFRNHLSSYLTKSDIEQLCQSFERPEQKGLILNPNKMSDEQFISLFPHVKRHPLVEHAYLYDQNEYEFGKMIYHDLGCYYIQDPSAALVSHFLNPKEGMQVLDMCAAPGGKTVQASFLMKGKGILYSNDLSHSRTQILLSNVERMGLGNVVVSSLDLSNIDKLKNSFDAIILDAPCSGSGMFRKSQEVKDDWTYEKVIKCQNIQKELILLAYSMLKEGGKLIYSTCSFSFEEDEEVVEYLLNNSKAALIPLKDYPSFYRSIKMPQAIHLFPSKFIGEGHFVALIQKPGELLICDKDEKEFHIQQKQASKGNSIIINNYILPQKPIKALIEHAIRPGLFVKSVIGNKEIITHHYSHFASANESYSLNENELKRYMHGETLVSNDNKNYTTVSYLGNNVGAVNKVNNILKNLYPKGLRR